MRLGVMVGILVLLFPLYAHEAAAQQSQPMEIPSHTDETLSPSNTSVKKGVGKNVYEAHCIVCHRSGLVGAPKIQDKKDWEPRMKKKKIQELVASSLRGLNAMPPKGTCSECSEQDLEAAIHYMLPKS